MDAQPEFFSYDYGYPFKHLPTVLLVESVECVW